MLDCGYNFSVRGDIAHAEITFEFDETLLKNKDFSPALYYFDEEKQLLLELDNQVVSGNTVSATVEHFSSYILLDKTEFYAVWQHELLYDGDDVTNEPDFYKDSDGDGISDYYEKAMASGRLVLGTGAPLYGIDYLNPDSDNDNLLDGQEITVIQSGGKVYVMMTSNPTLADTDGDGLQDDIDPRPLIPDMTDLLVHQTVNREGILKGAGVENNIVVTEDNTVADDLTFNDYSYWDLIRLGPTFLVAGITPEFMMWGEMIPLFYIGGVLSSSEIQQSLLDMVSAFRYANTDNV